MVIYRDMMTGAFNTPTGWRSAGRELGDPDLVKLEFDPKDIQPAVRDDGVSTVAVFDSVGLLYRIYWRFDVERPVSPEGFCDIHAIERIKMAVMDHMLCTNALRPGEPESLVRRCRAELDLRFGNDDPQICLEAFNRFNRMSPPERNRAYTKFRKESQAKAAA